MSGRSALALVGFGVASAPAALAEAAGGGGRMLVFFFALPVLLPLLGAFAAAIGLRRTDARWLWWTLCALLALNSALLGSVFRETSTGVVALSLSALQLLYAALMVSTSPPGSSPSRWKTRLWRSGWVLLCGALPALLTSVASW